MECIKRLGKKNNLSTALRRVYLYTKLILPSSFQSKGRVILLWHPSSFARETMDSDSDSSDDDDMGTDNGSDSCSI